MKIGHVETHRVIEFHAIMKEPERCAARVRENLKTHVRYRRCLRKWTDEVKGYRFCTQHAKMARSD